MLQHVEKRRAQSFQICAGEAAGGPARPDAGAKQAFVGVDVAYAGQQPLVQQRRFDGQAPAAKQAGEIGGTDGERLGSGPGEPIRASKVAEFEAPEAARVHKAQFAAALQRQACVRMACDGRVGSGHEQSAGHAEVNDPLC